MSLSGYSAVIVQPRCSASARASRSCRSTPFSRPSTSSEIRAYTATFCVTAATVAVLYRQCDTLFPGGPGKTTSQQTFTSLVDDLESRVFGALPDDTWFYPGHGDDSTLGAERPKVSEWRARGW